MKVLIIGANGKVGKKVVTILAKQQHEVIAMVRNEAQCAQFEKPHVPPVVSDLEKDLSPAFAHKPDVVVFTAGSGAHTGPDKTLAVDLQGAKKAIDESVRHKVGRFVMVSALGTNRPSEMPDNMRHYYTAKSEADQLLVQSGLDYTILRPGRLTDEPGKGNVEVAENLAFDKQNTISRDNVAGAITYAIDASNLNKKVIEMLDGPTPLNKAMTSL